MIVRFWGTRGSIPVAMTSHDLRAKIESALLSAIANGLRSPDAVPACGDREPDFLTRHTYGGHTPWVEIDARADA